MYKYIKLKSKYKINTECIHVHMFVNVCLWVVKWVHLLDQNALKNGHVHTLTSQMDERCKLKRGDSLGDQ